MRDRISYGRLLSYFLIYFLVTEGLRYTTSAFSWNVTITKFILSIVLGSLTYFFINGRSFKPMTYDRFTAKYSHWILLTCILALAITAYLYLRGFIRA